MTNYIFDAATPNHARTATVVDASTWFVGTAAAVAKGAVAGEALAGKPCAPMAIAAPAAQAPAGVLGLAARHRRPHTMSVIEARYREKSR